MAEQTNNKTIAKNTIFLYIRMMVTMVVSLYTSRVILQVLGVDDYGIYQAVGGIVGFLGFLNAAMSAGSSRFITFGLGEGDEVKLKKIFSTTLTGHIILALLIVFIAETAGLWFLHNKMVIPPDRLNATLWVFHLSVLTAFFTLTQVPYNACIIAHEKMSVYAYVSIIEAVLKLVIVYLLTIGNMDKLILYAILLAVLQLSILTYYRFYCVRRFVEAHFKLSIDKKLFKEIAGFSSWSLFANGSIALNSQGILILLNMFFSPSVVAARAISLQVNSAANQFVNNFQTAANPQIVKLYAAKEYEKSKQLLLQTTRFSFYLMLLLSLPICMTAEPLLKLWLGIVPEYSVIFLQIIVVQSLFHVFDVSFYRALFAKGQLRENALISPTLGFIQFPVVYLLFKMGCSPVALSWASLVTTILLGMVIKPILIIKIVNYTWVDIVSVFKPCLFVTLCSIPIPMAAYILLPNTDNMLLYFFCMVMLCIISSALACWYVGINKTMRNKLKEELIKKITRTY